MDGYFCSYKMISLKKQIIQECRRLLENRIANAKQAMNAAQEAANSEDKSSAGDKYETSRAMGQLARDMNAKQVAEAQAELNSLSKLTIDSLSKKVIVGSLVTTSQGIYLIAVGIGVIEIEYLKVIVLSSRSPLATMMMGKIQGDSFTFNNKTYEITTIS
jgi:transcription elongation GreA/GreB family factor